MSHKSSVYCCVPHCRSMKKYHAEKYFFTLPRDESRRQIWLQKIRRKDPPSVKTVTWVCSDHFNMDADLKNVHAYRLLRHRPLLKYDAAPSRFECQELQVRETVRKSTGSRERKAMANALLSDSGNMKCVVPTCNNKNNIKDTNKRIYYYNLNVMKKNRPDSFDAFVSALKLTNAGSFVDGAVVCSEHFGDEAYAEGELRRVASSTQVLTKPPRAPRLRNDAMPTLNIPESLPSAASKPRKRKSSTKKKGGKKIRRSRLTPSKYTRREMERSNTPQPDCVNLATMDATITSIKLEQGENEQVVAMESAMIKLEPQDEIATGKSESENEDQKFEFEFVLIKAEDEEAAEISTSFSNTEEQTDTLTALDYVNRATMDATITSIKLEPGENEQIVAMESAMIKLEPEDEIATGKSETENEDQKFEFVLIQAEAEEAAEISTSFSDTEEQRDTLTALDDTLHHQASEFICEHCFKVFSAQRNLANHVRSVHNAKKHTCDICDKDFAFKSQLNRHLPSHSSKPLFKCRECYRLYYNFGSLNSHAMRYNHFIVKFTCDFCQKIFAVKRSLVRHMKKTHIKYVNVVKCNFCNKIFNNNKNLFEHEKTYHKDAKYPCDICNKHLKNRRYLLEHKKYAHGNNMEYPCDFCGKKFKNKRSLRSHRWYTHINADEKCKKIICDICNKIFKNRITLREHKKRCIQGSNSEDNLYTCDIYKKMFKNKTYLNSHKKYMHSEPQNKEYPCDSCQEIFKHLHYLKNHKRAAHKI